MKEDLSFETFVIKQIINIQRDLLLFKSSTQRKKIIYNFLYFVSPIIEHWLKIFEQSQQIIDQKLRIDLKLPSHFEIIFTKNVEDFKKLYSSKRSIRGFTHSPLYTRGRRLVNRGLNSKKNSTGSVALILLLTNFYFCIRDWVRFWTSVSKITVLGCNQEHQLLETTYRMRNQVIKIIEKQFKKHPRLSNKELVEVKRVFKSILKNFFL